MEQELTILLVEDDPIASKEMIEYIDTLDDTILIDVTNNSAKAATIIQDCLPDVVILDLELHHGSGNGLSLLHSLQQMSLTQLPYILVTTNNSSQITYEAARQSGADFILSKHQDDYSVQTVVSFLRSMKSVIQGRKKNIMPTTENNLTPAQRNKRLTQRINKELEQIGISPKAMGYRYLIEAIQIIIHEPTQNLCSIIGQKFQKTESSVERAMQNAIAKAWKTTPIDDLLMLYTAKINSEKGVPTVTEFIYFYANKLKNEY